MKRQHAMPFGAECLPDGAVRFRLWAPKAQQVAVHLPGIAKTVPAKKLDCGWFEVTTKEASASSKYRFQIDGDQEVPDPASRFQPEDVNGPSQVVDPAAFEWQDEGWHGRPWQEAVLYELHLGTFTPEGTFAAAQQKLDYLLELGITAVELMPIADFAGARNWGYDGVLPFAPDSSYGTPDDLKRLIDAAHSKGLMMFLDVVYNHFGPEGNYLRVYAPEFFTDRHCTPWGEGINFDGPRNRAVRDFFIHNALYWLEEYHFDGLRLDAVDRIADDSNPDILTELAQAVRKKFGDKRYVHLVLENDKNQARYLKRDENSKPKLFNAQWNDDIHHAFHVLLTKERDGYYSDYADTPLSKLGRCLAEGFAYQGEASDYREGESRGEPSHELPPTAFVNFLQNHDQVGNRAFGERIPQLTDSVCLKAATAILLLAPSPPLLFMGEEFAAKTPFFFFCNFTGDLAKAVTEGRRNEFKRFAKFIDPEMRAQIPDPNSEATFKNSKLDWRSLQQRAHEEWFRFYQKLLRMRKQWIFPLLTGVTSHSACYEVFGSGLLVEWQFGGANKLTLLANMGNDFLASTPMPRGEIIFSTHEQNSGRLPPWSVAWYLNSCE